jgi:hypothetical protein
MKSYRCEQKASKIEKISVPRTIDISRIQTDLLQSQIAVLSREV